MSKRKTLEIIGVLSLSFILTSALAVSGGIPAMIEEFSSYSRGDVELLLSVTAFTMMLMIVLSPVIAKYIPERIVVAVGLLVYGVTGLIPVFVQSYPIIFASRIVFGLGTGLVNAKAITMNGERFTGDLQQKLQGIRCSMETLGQTILTLTAGKLLVFGWNYAFLVYTVSFIILIIFLMFVPEKEKSFVSDYSEEKNKGKLTSKGFPFIIGNALLGFLMVSTNVSLSLRISSYMLDTGIGSAADGAVIMSISTFAGFIAGIVFGSMSEKLGKYLQTVSLAIGLSGLFIITVADNLIFITAGAVLIGFCVTCCTSKVFGSLPERLPSDSLATANACVLVGCSMGSFTAPFVLRIIDQINPALKTTFIAYGFIYSALIVWFIVKRILHK